MLLLILSTINGHKQYVEKEPRKFLSGCLVFSLLMAIASGYIAANRKGDWFNAAFISFLFFFFFAICREFSGYYALMSGEETTQAEDKERKILIPLGITILLVGLITASILVNKTRVSPPAPSELRFWGGFPIEVIVFIVIGAFAESALGAQHGDKSYWSPMINVVFYFVVHMYLQFGGFYDHAFAPVDWGNLKTA